MTEQDRRVISLREGRAWILARYDHDGLSPAIFAVIRKIETEIAAIENRRTG